MHPTPQDNQLMSKHRVLGFKPQLRLKWRGQDGQNETEQADRSASLGDSITASTRIRFSVHTTRHLHPASTIGPAKRVLSRQNRDTSILSSQTEPIALKRLGDQ
jgi:hypothetical protein